MDIRDLLIEQTNLSVRAKNALHRNNIHTVGEMMPCTEETLYGMRNLGVKTVNEILESI